VGGTGGALGADMDAVMFDVKIAHLSLQRVGRAYAQPYGLTPARFDLMNALGSEGMLQKELWKRLNVTRSVVCEMVGALTERGWLSRERASDSRTWLVKLTEKGRAIFRALFDERVNSGDVAVTMERGLSRGGVVDNTLPVRERLLWDCDGIIEAYRTRPLWRGESLYLSDIEDYCYTITTFEEGTWGDVPFVTDVWETLEHIEIESQSSLPTFSSSETHSVRAIGTS
jgi:DNA-binding MarR family transcriptional regulator